MSAVAEQLRQTREAKSLTVQQVVDITKIRTDHLRALEEGNFDVFSAPVYIRGFVRSYATLLKLDVAQVMSALEAELAGTTKFAEPPPLTEHSHGVIDFLTLHLSKVDWRKASIGLSALLLLMAAVWGWHAWRHRGDPLKGVPPAMIRLHEGNTLPVPAPTPSR